MKKLVRSYSRILFPIIAILLVAASASTAFSAAEPFAVTYVKPFKEVSDLLGRKVAGPKGTVLHQLLLAGLDRAGVNPLDVGHIEMGIPEAVAALMSGTIDGALAGGPAALKAMENGARTLFDGEGLIEATILIGVSPGALKEIPDLPARMVKVHRGALAYAASHHIKELENTMKFLIDAELATKYVDPATLIAK